MNFINIDFLYQYKSFKTIFPFLDTDARTRNVARYLLDFFFTTFKNSYCQKMICDDVHVFF